MTTVCAGLVEVFMVLENMDKINRIMSLENDAVGYPVYLPTSLPWVHMDSDMETRSSTRMCFSACHRNEHRGSRCQGRRTEFEKEERGKYRRGKEKQFEWERMDGLQEQRTDRHCSTHWYKAVPRKKQIATNGDEDGGVARFSGSFSGAWRSWAWQDELKSTYDVIHPKIPIRRGANRTVNQTANKEQQPRCLFSPQREMPACLSVLVRDRCCPPALHPVCRSEGMSRRCLSGGKEGNGMKRRRWQAGRQSPASTRIKQHHA
ncbi:hypothetical protein LZ32DRAFT_418492 [Colletotrichum eremochloae]|nr:hypothetical protein LZ32DRAFT_418492 [Colletotrichum eremochloae]